MLTKIFVILIFLNLFIHAVAHYYLVKLIYSGISNKYKTFSISKVKDALIQCILFFKFFKKRGLRTFYFSSFINTSQKN
jgi:hypothetical protein